jgi:uncharacterized protein YfaT (DUF1175 family)
MSEAQKTNWFRALNDRVSDLAETFGLDDTQVNRFRDFAVQIAKEQYKVGSKSGASWAFKHAREKNPQARTT